VELCEFKAIFYFSNSAYLISDCHAILPLLEVGSIPVKN
jgi:hypothetical protein